MSGVLDSYLVAEYVTKELQCGRRVPAGCAPMDPPTFRAEPLAVAGTLSACVAHLGCGACAVAALTASVGPIDKGQGDTAVGLPAAGRVCFSVSSSNLSDPSHKEAHVFRHKIIAAFLDETFGSCIDCSALVIVGSEGACWQINVDVRLIEINGECFDLASLAVAFLLQRFTIPRSVLADGTETEDLTLEASALPVTLTTAHTPQRSLIVAPGSFEALVCDASIRVCVDVMTESVRGIEHCGGSPTAAAATESAIAVARLYAARVKELFHQQQRARLV